MLPKQLTRQLAPRFTLQHGSGEVPIEQLLPVLEEMLPHEPTSLPSANRHLSPECKEARPCEDTWRSGRLAG